MPLINPITDRLRQMVATYNRCRPEIMQAIGDEVVAFALDNFRSQSFNGVPWAKRKKENKRRPGRAILVDSGHLRNSIHIVSISGSTIHIGSDLPYAKIHNEGGEIRHPYREVDLYYSKDKNGKLRLAKTGTIGQQMKATEHRKSSSYNHVTRMPRRQFLGDSPELRTRIKAVVTEIIMQNLSNK